MLGLASISMLVSLGLTAGVMAGLLGIGGGMVVVPGLLFIFKFMQFPPEVVMHLAVGTSMGVMIFTSLSSTLSHQAKGDVNWPIFGRFIISIIIGVIAGALLDNHLNTRWIEIIFGIFLLLVSIKMFLKWQPTVKENSIPSLIVIIVMGLLIGFKSGLLGIGGGALSVPFLMYCNLPMHKAVGTSASFTLPIAVTGTIAFLLLGKIDLGVSLATGYIYLPALFLVAPFSVLGAILGTKLSHALPAQKLRILFAVFLLFVSARMLNIA